MIFSAPGILALVSVKAHDGSGPPRPVQPHSSFHDASEIHHHPALPVANYTYVHGVDNAHHWHELSSAGDHHHASGHRHHYYDDHIVGQSHEEMHDPFTVAPPETWDSIDRDMCPSPSDSLRISRFPSPPTHPFDPYYEMKMHAVDCMINSPPMYTSSDESATSEDDSSPERYELDYAGRESPGSYYVSREDGGERWPSPSRMAPRGQLRAGKHVSQRNAHAEHVMNHPQLHHKGRHSGKAPLQSTRGGHTSRGNNAMISNPGVGYFKLPESFIQEFAI